jgi:hypothetical protein
MKYAITISIIVLICGLASALLNTVYLIERNGVPLNKEAS